MFQRTKKQFKSFLGYSTTPHRVALSINGDNNPLRENVTELESIQKEEEIDKEIEAFDFLSYPARFDKLIRDIEEDTFSEYQSSEIDELLIFAVTNGHIRFLKMIIEKFPRLGNDYIFLGAPENRPSTCLELAIEKNQIGCVQYLLPIWLHPLPIHKAVNGGNKNIVLLFFLQDPNCMAIENHLKENALKVMLAKPELFRFICIEFLNKKMNLPVFLTTEDEISLAIFDVCMTENFPLSTFIWYLENNPMTGKLHPKEKNNNFHFEAEKVFLKQLTEKVIIAKRLDILQYLREHRLLMFCETSVPLAEKSGNSKLLQWVLGQLDVSIIKEILKGAIKDNDLALVRKLLESLRTAKMITPWVPGSRMPENDYGHEWVMLAAKENRLEILKYFKETFSYPFHQNTAALAIAAEAGHTEIVYWIFDECFCPARALFHDKTFVDIAAENGHVAILSLGVAKELDKYLVSIRPVKKTPLFIATRCNQVKIFEHLLSQNHYYSAHIPLALIEAIIYDAKDIVQFIFQMKSKPRIDVNQFESLEQFLNIKPEMFVIIFPYLLDVEGINNFLETYSIKYLDIKNKCREYLENNPKEKSLVNLKSNSKHDMKSWLMTSESENKQSKFSILRIRYEDLGLIHDREFDRLLKYNYPALLKATKEMIEQQKYDWLEMTANTYGEVASAYFTSKNEFFCHQAEYLYIEYNENEKDKPYLISFQMVTKNKTYYMNVPIRLEKRPFPWSSPIISTSLGKEKEKKHKMKEKIPFENEGSTLPQSIQNLENGKNDYLVELQAGKASIGICRIQGRRDYQEDRCIAATGEIHQSIKEKLEENIQIAEPALRQTFSKLQKEYGNYPNQGSTACFAIAKHTAINLTTSMLTVELAYAGDSAAYLVEIREDGNVTARKLTNPHHPKYELERLKQIPLTPLLQALYGVKSVGDIDGFFWRDRLIGGLAVSRSFGDTNFEKAGLIHEAEIKQETITFVGKPTLLLILASDGMEENVKNPEAFIMQVVKKHWSHSTKLLAEQLVNHAYNGLNDDKSKSEDNICAVVVELVLDELVSAGLFDGHGGGEVSELISQHFYPVFHTNLSLMYEFINKNEGDAQAELENKSLTDDNETSNEAKPSHQTDSNLEANRSSQSLNLTPMSDSKPKKFSLFSTIEGIQTSVTSPPSPMPEGLFK